MRTRAKGGKRSSKESREKNESQGQKKGVRMLEVLEGGHIPRGGGCVGIGEGTGV